MVLRGATVQPVSRRRSIDAGHQIRPLPVPQKVAGRVALGHTKREPRLPREARRSRPAAREQVADAALADLVILAKRQGDDRCDDEAVRRVEDAEEGYQSMAGLYEKKLYPSVQGIRNVIRLLGTTNEKIRRLKAEDLVDDSVVKKLEKDGRF